MGLRIREQPRVRLTVSVSKGGNSQVVKGIDHRGPPLEKYQNKGRRGCSSPNMP